MGKAAKDDADGLPEVAVGIVGGLAEGALAEAAEAVAGGVGLAGGGRGVRGMEKLTFLGAEEEEAAVDETEQLLEIFFLCESPIHEAFAECGVARVFQEAIAKLEKSLLDTIAKAIADAEPLSLSFGFPFFPDAIRGGGRWLRRWAWRLETAATAGVEDAPEGGEVGVAVLVVAEDGFEVEFEEVRPREGIGISEEAEGFAVGDDGPKGIGRGVEEFLGELVGGFFPGAGADDGEAGIRVVEAEVMRGDDDGKASAEGLGGDGETAWGGILNVGF